MMAFSPITAPPIIVPWEDISPTCPADCHTLIDGDVAANYRSHARNNTERMMQIWRSGKSSTCRYVEAEEHSKQLARHAADEAPA